MVWADNDIDRAHRSLMCGPIVDVRIGQLALCEGPMPVYCVGRYEYGISPYLFIVVADVCILDGPTNILCGPIQVAGFVLGQGRCGQGPCLFTASADINIYSRPTTTWAGPMISYYVG
jgi:hypothetical protein